MSGQTGRTIRISTLPPIWWRRFMQFDEAGIACEALDLDPLTVRALL